jgi:hypothetical protein
MTNAFVAALSKYTALDNSMLKFDRTFFVGLSGINSVVLVATDRAKYFQPRTDSVCDFVFNSLVRPCSLCVSYFIVWMFELFWEIHEMVFTDARIATEWRSWSNYRTQYR